jgi:hypothetical protein
MDSGQCKNERGRRGHPIVSGAHSFWTSNRKGGNPASCNFHKYLFDGCVAMLGETFDGGDQRMSTEGTQKTNPGIAKYA